MGAHARRAFSDPEHPCDVRHLTPLELVKLNDHPRILGQPADGVTNGVSHLLFVMIRLGSRRGLVGELVRGQPDRQLARLRAAKMVEGDVPRDGHYPREDGRTAPVSASGDVKLQQRVLQGVIDRVGCREPRAQGREKARSDHLVELFEGFAIPVDVALHQRLRGRGHGHAQLYDGTEYSGSRVVSKISFEKVE
jgi:hypothetical protein